MADAIGLAAGLLSIGNAFKTTIRVYSAIAGDSGGPEQQKELALNAQLYGAVLEETAHLILVDGFPMSRTIMDCLELCKHRIEELNVAMERWLPHKSTRSDGLRKQVGRASKMPEWDAKLKRDLTNTVALQLSLNEQANDTFNKLVMCLQGSQMSSQGHFGSELKERLDHLREEYPRTGSRDTSKGGAWHACGDQEKRHTESPSKGVFSADVPRPKHSQTFHPHDESIPLEFTVTIMGSLEGSGDNLARCLLDSGSQDNWISIAVLERAKLEDMIEELADPPVYVGFGGNYQPMGKATVTWYGVNTATSRTTEFLVYDRAHFDMILEEALAMETRARERAADQAHISNIRRADEAAARDRRRREREAARGGAQTPLSIHTIDTLPASTRNLLTYRHQNPAESSMNMQVSSTEGDGGTSITPATTNDTEEHPTSHDGTGRSFVGDDAASPVASATAS
ncbi:MAG: hypothetical protein Q9162_006841 [Coniocarpon cinnabarinum]